MVTFPTQLQHTTVRVRTFFQKQISGTQTDFFRTLKFALTLSLLRGTGARENRGREGYGRRERKGQKAGVLRGREVREKCEMLIFLNSTMH